MNALDMVIAVYILIQVLIGYQRGAVESLFSLLGYFFTAVVTYLFYIPVKQVLVSMTGLDETIAGFIGDRLRDLGASSVQSTVSNSDLNAMNKLPLPQDVSQGIEQFLIHSADGAAQNVTTELTDFMMTIIAIIGLFFAVIIAVKMIASMMNIITKLPVIHSFNHLLGIVFGLVKSYIVLSIVALLAMTLASLNDWPFVFEQVSQSTLAQLLINNNLFLIFFSYLPT